MEEATFPSLYVRHQSFDLNRFRLFCLWVRGMEGGVQLHRPTIIGSPLRYGSTSPAKENNQPYVAIEEKVCAFQTAWQKFYASGRRKRDSRE